MRPTHLASRSTVLLGLVLLGGCAPSTGLAQRSGPAPASVDTSLLRALTWRNIGPNRGGRSIAAAGSSKRPLEYFFGATGGGVWKTEDAGVTWKPVSDKFFGSSSVGALGVCDANPDVVYAGMGETELRGNIIQGDGVYKSTDAGKTWAHAGLPQSQAIARVRVDPTDCNRVYAAVLGHPYAPNPERGVFRSTDGGKTWSNVLFRNDSTGAVDLVMAPGNPRTLYAGFWQVQRTPWSLSSGGAGSGLFRSTDGGDHWTELTRNPGLPEGIWGKVGVSVSGADPSRVYAIIEAREGGVFRSDDAGATWTRVNDERKLRQRAFYYTRIYADPKDRQTVYVLNVKFWKSTDGGKRFKQIKVPHGDNHDLWIDPANPERMIQANDGGANVSWNGGDTWTEQDFPTAQMYHVVTTNHTPYHVCGAQQDNSTACVPSSGNGDYWYAVGGGESGYIAPDPTDNDVFYAGSYGGLLTRYDRGNGQQRNIQVYPSNPMGHSSEDIQERFQWTFPILISPHDPRVLLTGSQHLWKSTNEGQSWTRISPNLTRSDPRTLGPSGGPITLDQTGVETYGTIFSVAPSPKQAGVIWTGSDDGLVYVTRDNGANWQNVTPPGLPEFARISLVEASPHEAGRAYVAANRYQLDDRAPYLFRTEDYGQTWTKIVNGIAPGDFARTIREDPQRPGMLYAGTEHGIYVSWDDGARWQSLRRGLPDTQVSDLVVLPKDLVIATHGRSFYVMDDIAPLRQMGPRVSRDAVHLFAPSTTTRSVDRGATVYYTLRKPAKRVTLEFIDSAGKVIRSFTGTPADTVEKQEKEAEADTARAALPADTTGELARKQTETPAETAQQTEEKEDEEEEEEEEQGGSPKEPKPSVKAGLNRFVWNLRYPGAARFPKMILWAAGTNGPEAVPGVYSVRINADGRTATQQFRVVKDPRLTGVTQAELEAQFALAMQIRDRTSQANEAVLLIRGIRKQLDARKAATQSAAIKTAADSLEAQLAGVENAIYQTKLQSKQDPLNFPIRLNNKIAALQGVVGSADAPPTEQGRAVFQQLSAELAIQIAALDAVVRTDLPRLNARLRTAGLKPVEAKPLPAEEAEE